MYEPVFKLVQPAESYSGSRAEMGAAPQPDGSVRMHTVCVPKGRETACCLLVIDGSNCFTPPAVSEQIVVPDDFNWMDALVLTDEGTQQVVRHLGTDGEVVSFRYTALLKCSSSSSILDGKMAHTLSVMPQCMQQAITCSTAWQVVCLFVAS